MSRIIIFILFFKSVEVFSQKNQLSEQDAPNARFDFHYLKLKPGKIEEKKAFPFNSVTVMDERFDTSKLGYSFINSSIPRRKFCFQNGTRKEVLSFFHEYLHENYSPLNNTLIVCLKKFWITSYGKKYHDLLIKIEFYLKEDSCYRPLYRIDSIFSVQGDLSTCIENSLKQTTTKLSKISNFEYKQLLCQSLKQVEVFNENAKQIAVLKEKKAAKGVYLDFEQFRNNKPAFVDFEVSFDKLTDIVYVKDHQGKDSAIVKLWAISDGETAYIKYGYNFFPLFRNGYNFDFYAFDRIVQQSFFYETHRPVHRNTNPTMSALELGLQGILNNIQTRSKNLMPLQLDMENGKVY